MKVIYENPGYDVGGTCKRCGSDLIINTFDLKRGLLGFYVRCPVCNIKSYIPDSELYRFGIKSKD